MKNSEIINQLIQEVEDWDLETLITYAKEQRAKELSHINIGNYHPVQCCGRCNNVVGKEFINGFANCAILEQEIQEDYVCDYFTPCQ